METELEYGKIYYLKKIDIENAMLTFKWKGKNCIVRFVTEEGDKISCEESGMGDSLWEYLIKINTGIMVFKYAGWEMKQITDLVNIEEDGGKIGEFWVTPKRVWKDGKVINRVL